MRRLAIRIGLLLAVGVTATAGAFVLRRAAQAAPARKVEIGLPPARTVETRFPPPAGFARLPVPAESFGAWLRALPLRPADTLVRLHTGALKARQDVHAAVVDRDPGPKNLQQCADAVIRLRAEYLHGAGRGDEIAFHFTSGFRCDFATWRRGGRPRVDGSDVRWVETGVPGDGEEALRRYLEVVYTYAATASLPRDVVPVRDVAAVEPGDVFLRPGSPGHAMIVVDVAERDGARAVLLAQSYMPAQDIHVVRNLQAPALSPWFLVEEGRELVTPEWTFARRALYRFRDASAPSGVVRGGG